MFLFRVLWSNLFSFCTFSLCFYLFSQHLNVPLIESFFLISGSCSINLIACQMRMTCMSLEDSMSKSEFIFYLLSSNVLKLESGIIFDTLFIYSSSQQRQDLLTTFLLLFKFHLLLSISTTFRRSMKSQDLEVYYLDQNSSSTFVASVSLSLETELCSCTIAFLGIYSREVET